MSAPNSETTVADAPRWRMFGLPCVQCGHSSDHLTGYQGRVVTVHRTGAHLCLSDPAPPSRMKRGPYRKRHLKAVTDREAS